MKIIEQIGFTCCTDNLPFLNCIRISCFYMMSVNSFVDYYAVIFIEDACNKLDIKPRDLLNWHSEKLLKLMTDLSMFAFLNYGYGLDKTFFMVSLCLLFAFLFIRFIRK